ncbi:MAG: cation acetate symporter [Candidatus Eremiobacteraeota bacterium]|nr:cation acetate symporter [Candidatus Eremiobacteraeota bacterium]
MFALFVAIALVITYWAAGRSTSSRGFYTANHQISGVQNGWAIAGDYMSGASFLGIAGLIAFYGFDGFLYAAGWLVAYLVVLFLLAEPLRNAGRYTVADVIGFRLGGRGVRAIAALTTIAITLFYMIAQLVGAGSIVNLFIQRFDEPLAIVFTGILMMIYVLFGGMLATTWVQIFKAAMLLIAGLALSLLVLAHFDFSFAHLFAAGSNVTLHSGTINLLQPEHFFTGPYGALDLISLSLALVIGTAGLPHILMRFFTVPSAAAARTSIGWAMALIGVFYLMTSVIGLGAATIVGPEHIGKQVRDVQAIRYIAFRDPQQAPQLNADLAKYGYIVPRTDSNVTAPTLANAVGGQLLFAFVAAVIFATILAVVAGLMIAASSAFSHDIWYMLVRNKAGTEHEYMLVARTTAIIVGIAAIFFAVKLRGANVAALLGLAFAVAASANVPALLLSLTWRRFTRTAAICSMVTGLVASLGLIALGPDSLHEHALFPLRNPAIVSLPLAFIAAVAATLVTRDKQSEEMFTQLQVRAEAGLGAEV